MTSKGNPADIRAFAEDLDRCIRDHPDACRFNPDLQAETAKLRDKAYKRWEQVAEKGKGFDQNGDLIP